MNHLLQLRRMFPGITQLAKHVPLELSLGLLSVVLLSVTLGLLVWNFNLSDIQPDIAAWLMRRTAILSFFVLILGWCAVYRPLLDRFLFQAVWARWIVFGCYFGVLMTLYSHIVTLVFSLAQVTWVTKVSLWYLDLDTRLGVYEYLDPVVGFFISNEFWYRLVSSCYEYTLYVAVMSIFVVAVFSARQARQFFLTTVVSLILVSTLWLALPAIAPHQLSITDNLHASGYAAEVEQRTAPVQDLYLAYGSTDWSDQVADYSYYWESVTVFFGYAVSSNPSVHVIWGVLMTVFLWRSHWLLGLFGLVFTGLETVGTMLFLQHYLIDIPGGILFGLLAVIVSGKLLKFEERNLAVERSFWFYPLVFLEKFGKWIAADWKRQKEIMGW